MYLGAWSVGGTIYGDIIPYAMSEQLFNQVTTFLSRIVVAFIYAQASGYISSIYMTYSNHIESKNMLIEYLEIHNMPSDVRKHVNKYYEILWNNFRGMDEDEIMGDLPESITKQIKLFVFSGFTEKLTIFPKEDKAAITSLLTRLKINLVPEGEYIIREREIRDCIYFIIRGSVLIVSGGIILATLEQGAIFGEMAIAEIPTVRNASAFCITPVWVGSLSIDDFKIICTSYPSFEHKIQTEVERRKADNLIKTPNIKFKEHSKTASPLKRPSRFINNFEKSWSALSRVSKESSKKGSRQSVYEIDEEEKLEQKFFKNALLQRFNYSGLKNKVKMKVYSFNNQRYQNLKNDSNSNNSRESNNSSHKHKFIENPNVPHSIVESSSENINQLHISKSNSQNKSSSKSKESIEPNLHNLKPVSTGDENKCCKLLENIKRIILILLQVYNIVFIPIQGAYRTKYSIGFIILEVITILFYMTDLLLLWRKYQKIKRNLSKVGFETETNNIVWKSVDAQKKKLVRLKIYFFTSIFSCFPFAMVFSLSGIDQPYLIIYYLKWTRLLKIWPLQRLSNLCKKYYLKITRIVEMLLIYYIFTHLIAWSLICIAYEVPDIRTTWLKRLPVPQPTGVRQYADRTGLSDVSIYCHAFNFAVNTLSHVATGEVSMVTYQERIYWAFLIWFATFMYAFLFGNIASIVSDLAPQKMFFKFYKRYESVMSSLKIEVVPKKLIINIKDYFDFTWSNSHGTPIDELSNKLPPCVNADILAARYSNAVKKFDHF